MSFTHLHMHVPRARELEEIMLWVCVFYIETMEKKGMGISRIVVRVQDWQDQKPVQSRQSTQSSFMMWSDIAGRVQKQSPRNPEKVP